MEKLHFRRPRERCDGYLEQLGIEYPTVRAGERER